MTKNKVPSAIMGRGSRSRHMGIERELWAKYRMLVQDAHKKYDELEVIFQRIVEVKAEIEEQRQKQEIEQ